MCKLLLAAILSFGILSSTVVAQDIDSLTELLRMRLGTEDVAKPIETPIEGVYQTRFGDKYAYLIDNGRFVFIGDLIDLKEARNLTEISRRDLVSEELANVSLDKLTVYPAVDEEKAVLNVFTDTSCGYCQRLHQEVKFLQEAGITVKYFPFPRGGERGPGYANLKKVWCAEDRQSAMDIAKGTASGDLDDGDCEAASFIDESHKLGNLIGVTGTPALYTATGVKFNGYVPYQQLIPQLVN